MQDFFINIILKINKRYFFKKSHPFNTAKDWTLNLNYSDFEYSHVWELLSSYEKLNPLAPLSGGIDKVLRNKAVLEVGCWGWGKAVYIAEKYDSKVVWIDISDNFLNQANKFAIEKWVSNSVSFYNKSATNSWFNDEEFDIIIMSDVIEHIPNTEKLFDEALRLLKKWWIILFDFAPYYHYFWHHLWDTIQVPWIHMLFTDKFLIKLYKCSVKDLIDWNNRVNLRIWKNPHPNPLLIWEEIEQFDYLNKISRKEFEKIIKNFVSYNDIKNFNIKYFILKDMNFISKLPLLREVFIRHIVWYIKK